MCLPLNIRIAYPINLSSLREPNLVLTRLYKRFIIILAYSAIIQSSVYAGVNSDGSFSEQIPIVIPDGY